MNQGLPNLNNGLAHVKHDSAEAKIDHSPGPPGSMERLIALYRAIRPMLRAIIGMPLLLPGWRKVIEMFVATLDVVAVSIDPTFGSTPKSVGEKR